MTFNDPTMRRYPYYLGYDRAVFTVPEKFYEAANERLRIGLHDDYYRSSSPKLGDWVLILPEPYMDNDRRALFTEWTGQEPISPSPWRLILR